MAGSSSPPTKAVVLAAGRGTRMKSLTDDCPKPMLPLAGRPMLAHQMSRLGAAGIRSVCVVVGYRGDVIRDYFADHPQEGIRLVFVEQAEPTGTGTAALLAREFVGRDTFLLTFGDIVVAPQVYRKLQARSQDSEIVVALTRVDDPYRGGAVYVEGDRLTRIVEKPPKGTSTTNFLCAGVYAFRHRIFEALEQLNPSPRGEYDLTQAISDTVLSGHIVRCFEIPGFWRDVGRPEDLGPASDYLDRS